ncbi:PAS domain S-box protein [Pseudomonas cedrina]|uniref:PAS domain S-box protein n=1 Tax=Pseudomonas cedrina TaxID=651740 RepID=UPI003ED96222
MTSLPPLTFGLREVLEALPEAIYTTDASGLITFYNKAAASLWGAEPALGEREFWGSSKLYWPDGTPLPHDECPLSVALKERRPIRGVEVIAERPDGTRIRLLACPSPIFDATGVVVGAVNMLIELPDQSLIHEAALRHDAIVESSDDAIIAKDLNGVITNWNRGAQRLFGYTPDEAMGKPIEMLIPLDRKDEEPDILRRIRLGERIEHYETIRRRKDGSLVEISLSVSPVKNREGRIIGAAKIARDITDRRQAEEQKSLLIQEMDHRIKNLFTLANSVVLLSVRSVETPAELATTVSARLASLAQAHALTVPNGFRSEQTTTLHALIKKNFAPYATHEKNSQPRVNITGPDLSIAGHSVITFALLLHEFTTNAAKYGALSIEEGGVLISCNQTADLYTVIWREINGPCIQREPEQSGFGTALAQTTIRGQLRGEITREWNTEGLVIRLVFSVSRVKLLS